MDIIKHFDRNINGHDYVVGDIHGCFHVVQEILKRIRFNPKTDRLFSVGDLVNRGPQSHLVNQWLSLPWFHPVRGNHEHIALDAFSGEDLYGLRSGDWLARMKYPDLHFLHRALNNLPIAIEVAVPNGRVGIIHGDILHTDWNMFKRDIQVDGLHSKLGERTIWKRSRYKHKLDVPVNGVNVVYTGHTVVDAPTTIANVAYIDTGCCYGKKLTIVNLHDGKTFSLDYFVPA